MAGGLQMTGYTNAGIGWTLFILAALLFVSPAIEHALGLNRDALL
jgi:hypothetical protein